jgi:hypothetical protein
MAARDEHYKETTEWPARSHKKVNSEELCEVGAQFYLPFGQGSSQRADRIDIEEEEPLPRHNSAGNLAFLASSTRERRPNDTSSQDAAKTTSFNAQPSTYHHISKEDVAILIAHRDRARDRASRTCTLSPPTILYCCFDLVFD